MSVTHPDHPTMGPPEPEDETTVMGNHEVSRGLDGGLRRGDALGRYLVLDVLGRGGMGIVYAAYDPQLDRRVAIKLVGQGASSVEDSRLLREAQALAKLNHPNVVSVHDVGTWRSSVFVAMELVEGETLDAWIQRRHAEAPPSWQEVLEVMLPAGRGLEAAHAVGIVHRDFKPHNVMLAPSGRVTVLDFGLARALEPGETATGTTDGARLPVTSLTETGTVMGTPAYMSPEQHEGRRADERSDQFSFCVTLYQAIYGRRPFSGSSVGDLLTAIAIGRFDPTRPGDGVPGWLRAVVVRGLEPVPDARYASMTELLAALRSPPTRGAPLVVGAVLGLGLLGGLGWALLGRSAPDPCQPAEDAMARAWGTEPRAAVESAFRKDGGGGAPREEVLEQVSQDLDDFASEWLEERRAVCALQPELGSEAERVATKRATCLDQRLGRFDALVRLLAEADHAMVIRATQAVQDLPPPEDCRDARGWSVTVPLPDEPDARASAESLLLRSDEVYALAMMGRMQQALPQVEELLAEAQATGFAPLRVHMMRLAGNLYTQLGNYERAKELLGGGLELSRLHGLDMLEFQIRDPLIFLALGVDEELAVAELHIRMQEVLTERMGNRPMMRARTVHNRARLADARGDDAALELYRAAIPLYEEADVPVVDLLVVYDNLASAYEQAGRFDDAAELVARAETIAAEGLGPEHPQHGHLLIHAARIDHSRGDYESSTRKLEAAVRNLEGAYGPRHPNVAAALNGLAILYDTLGRPKDAEATYRRAMDILVSAYEVEHPSLRTIRKNLGILLRHSGRADEALGLHVAARSSTDEVELRLEIGNDLLALGRCEDAETELQAALALAVEQADGAEADPISEARALRAMGLCAWKRGDLERARGLIERSLQRAEQAPEDGRWTQSERAMSRFGLALVLRKTDAERAEALAEQARAFWAEKPVQQRHRLEVMRAWQAGEPVELFD
ncbi:MAG: tetratricopeptide repeat protein [Myxococcales bacterium]|nr:tetratricopeptide repeat protein [Myxococcales bacterium]MCB9715734.1 tetratricopeptide repeat protein [Myxococcales bacterium]